MRFAFLIQLKSVRRNDVLVRNHEGNSRTWVSPSLAKYGSPNKRIHRSRRPGRSQMRSHHRRPSDAQALAGFVASGGVEGEWVAGAAGAELVDLAGGDEAGEGAADAGGAELHALVEEAERGA